jgi:hypothetical protein
VGSAEETGGVVGSTLGATDDAGGVVGVFEAEAGREIGMSAIVYCALIDDN